MSEYSKIMARALEIASDRLSNMEKEENTCVNCGECKCITCRQREISVSGSTDCNRCDFGCEDIPVENCEDYEFCDY